jgi:Protein of unknown function (DUF3048) N-terminal domain/Protein of unknown function (DUF3048) C-terminal domain
MLRRMSEWARSNPWRPMAIVLALGIIVVTALYLAAGGEEPADGEAMGTTMTTVTLADGSPVTSATIDGGSPAPDGVGLLAVKIDNAPSARPQVGLAEASLLVEVPVEGGMTRFVAVYPGSASGLVGPIRSLRPVDADLLPALAVQVLSTGGQPFVVQAVRASGVEVIDPSIFSLFISGGREPPSDTFLDLESVVPLVAGALPEGMGLPSGVLPTSDESAAKIGLPFGDVELRFADGVYTRYEAGEALSVLDSLDGPERALSHETVVVMFVAQRSAGYQDSNGAEVPTFDVIGGGNLIVAHGGSVVRGTWARSAQADPFVFEDVDGEMIGIPSGSTYLALVPRDLGIEINP